MNGAVLSKEAGPPGFLQSAFSPELWARLQHLDGAATRNTAAATPQAATTIPPPRDLTAPTYDVVLAGGGLHVVLAPLLAARGLRVAVVERARAGQAHREWNAAADELAALVDVGLCTAAELAAMVVARYSHGTCAWHGGGSYAVAGVLDCAIDAGRLLDHARTKATQAGVRFLDGAEVIAERADADGVWLQIRTLQRAKASPTNQWLRAAALVDARGASSPYARHDLVCPTVGGVLTGLDVGKGRDKIDPRVGEILATTEGVEDGRQHVWEAFPGAPGQTTVYLFAYALRGEVGPQPLARLYRRFVATLPRFKTGKPQLLRPTFGLIPGWSRRGQPSTSPHPRIVLVGDAASRHSPLTFCGFGATLRSLARTVAHVTAVARGEHTAASAVDDRPIHAITGALALLLARPPRSDGGDGERLNRLLNAAFATLHGMGPAAYAAMLNDTMAPATALRFLLQTAGRHSGVWRDVYSSLGPAATLAWAGRVARLALRHREAAQKSSKVTALPAP